MIGVHVGDDDRIELRIVDRGVKISERAAADVEQHRRIARSQQVTAAGAPRPLNGRTRTDHAHAYGRRHYDSDESTSSACSSTLTRGQTLTILPFSSMENVERWIPRRFFPYIVFSTITPNASQSFDSVSASSANGMEYFFLNF